MNPALLSRLTAIVADVTGASPARLDAASGPGLTPGWDSQANLQIMVAIEEELDVVIPTQAVLTLRSLGEIARYLEDKVPAK